MDVFLPQLPASTHRGSTQVDGTLSRDCIMSALPSDARAQWAEGSGKKKPQRYCLGNRCSDVSNCFIYYFIVNEINSANHQTACFVKNNNVI